MPIITACSCQTFTYVLAPEHHHESLGRVGWRTHGIHSNPRCPAPWRRWGQIMEFLLIHRVPYGHPDEPGTYKNLSDVQLDLHRIPAAESLPLVSCNHNQCLLVIKTMANTS